MWCMGSSSNSPCDTKRSSVGSSEIANRPPITGREADIELSAYLAIRVRDDVTRVGVGADETRGPDAQTRLFLDLADRRTRQRVGHLHATTGERP